MACSQFLYFRQHTNSDVSVLSIISRKRFPEMEKCFHQIRPFGDFPTYRRYLYTISFDGREVMIMMGTFWYHSIIGNHRRCHTFHRAYAFCPIDAHRISHDGVDVYNRYRPDDQEYAVYKFYFVAGMRSFVFDRHDIL